MTISLKKMTPKIKSQKYAQGSSLIELLVSLIIMATGIMGMAGLQSKSLKSSKSSYYQTQANMLINDLANRIRANASSEALSVYQITTKTDQYEGTNVNCSQGCTPKQMARSDLKEWISNVNTALPSSEVEISKPSNSHIYTITLLWEDPRSNEEDFCESRPNVQKLCLTAKIKICASGTIGSFEQCES